MKTGFEILVVDDETLVRESIKMLLELEGHKVSTVDNGETALEELAQRKFDLVITDFLMPGIHGDELVGKIRQLAPALPIILVTAFIAEYKAFGQANGRANAVLLKPFSQDDLREVVDRVLTREEQD